MKNSTNFICFHKKCYHIAISKNPNDAAQQIERLFNYDIDDIKLLRVGKIEKDTNVVFYIMVDSLKLDAILKVFNLESNGFFINIGYKYTDIYDKQKNTILEKTSKFRQLLASEYYNNENWNFIYDIENFDAPRLNEYTEIIPLEITDNILRVKYNNLILDITWLENKFWIVAEYPVEKEYNRMTKSKIDKLLKWKNY